MARGKTPSLKTLRDLRGAAFSVNHGSLTLELERVRELSEHAFSLEFFGAHDHPLAQDTYTLSFDPDSQDDDRLAPDSKAKKARKLELENILLVPVDGGDGFYYETVFNSTPAPEQSTPSGGGSRRRQPQKSRAAGKKPKRAR